MIGNTVRVSHCTNRADLTSDNDQSRYVTLRLKSI